MFGGTQPDNSGNTPYIFDVTEADFEEKVVMASREVPVVVDFWGPNCAPCRTLTPALERVVETFKGGVILAKCNVEENRRLAMMFRVQAVPTVYVLRDGQPVDGFQGAQPESAIQEMLARHAVPVEQDPMEVAKEALAAGNPEVAQAAFMMLLQEDPKNGEALLGMARLALTAGHTDDALELLDRVEDGDPSYQAAQRLRGVADFGADAGDLAALSAKVVEDPADCSAWYSLGATQALAGDFEASFDAFLEVVERDREHREDGARKALLSLFDLVGTDDPLVQRYRRKLANLLF